MSKIEGFSAAPGVLVAMPGLEDPHFHRSVVLMIEHDDEGALGLVINHVIEHDCADVAATFGLPWPADPADRLLRGGPVEPPSLWILHADRWQFDETNPVAPGVAVSRSREALTRLCEGGEAQIRLVVGYAGWGPGQLEEEVVSGSWIVAPVDARLVFEGPSEGVWARALASLGINPLHLVEIAPAVQ